MVKMIKLSTASTALAFKLNWEKKSYLHAFQTHKKANALDKNHFICT
jgi:hypothetical protein